MPSTEPGDGLEVRGTHLAVGLQKAPHLGSEVLESVVVNQPVSDPLKLSSIHEKRNQVGFSLYQSINLWRGSALLAELAIERIEALLLGWTQADLECWESQARTLQNE